MKTSLPALLLLLSILFSQCTKDDDCCTCEVGYSESGSGTMGCLMDGTPWAPCNFAHEEVKGSVNAYRENFDGRDYWQITNSKFFNGGDEALFITLWFPKVGIITKANIDPLNSYGTINAEFYTQQSKLNGKFARDTSYPYTIEITKLDTINHIISGRFECTLIENDGGVDTAKIRVTNGVFDSHF